MFKDFDFWFDQEDSGAVKLFVALNEDNIIGFQSVDEDNLCVAIEVIKSARNQGVAKRLIKASGCSEPRLNINPDFWNKISKGKHGSIFKLRSGTIN